MEKAKGWWKESQRKSVILFTWNRNTLVKINNPYEAALPQEIQLEPGNTGMRGGTNLQTTHPLTRLHGVKLQGTAYLQYSTVKGCRWNSYYHKIEIFVSQLCSGQNNSTTVESGNACTCDRKHVRTTRARQSDSKTQIQNPAGSNQI